MCLRNETSFFMVQRILPQHSGKNETESSSLVSVKVTARLAACNWGM